MPQWGAYGLQKHKRGKALSIDSELRKRLDSYTADQRLPLEKCPAQRLLESLDDETRKIVEETLFDLDFPYNRLHRELRRAGFKIKAESLAYHRKGECVCRLGDDA